MDEPVNMKKILSFVTPYSLGSNKVANYMQVMPVLVPVYRTSLFNIILSAY
jgi:hypothetical protein